MQSLNTFIHEKLHLQSNRLKESTYFVPNNIDELNTYIEKQKAKVKNSNDTYGTKNNPVDLSYIDFSKLLAKETYPDWLFDNNDDIEALNVSNWKLTTTDKFTIDHMFSETNIKYIDVSDWELSGEYINMCALFAECHSLVEIVGLNTWDVTDVRTITSMFRSCDNLKSIDLSSWKTSNFARMRGLFAGCSSLKEVNLTGWNVTKVEKCGRMFFDCQELQKIDGIEDWKLSSCVDIQEMFANCYKLKADLHKFMDNLNPNVKTTKDMFYHAEHLNPNITEKLHINNNVKLKNVDMDNVDKDLLLAIIKSVFISVYKNRTYKIIGVSKYSIKRSEIKWEDILEILETEYNYMMDEEEVLNKKGKFQTFVRKRFDLIEGLINMKTSIVKTMDGPLVLKGSDIYWNDWKQYREKYDLT